MPDERGVSWKVLLPLGPQSRVCAVGLDEGAIAGLRRSYDTVDTEPTGDVQYDAVIVGDQIDGRSSDARDLVHRVKHDGVFVDTGKSCDGKTLYEAGFNVSRCYAALPPDNPRVFVPLASRRLRDKGLAFHSPGSARARMSLAAAKVLNCLGVKRHLAKHAIALCAQNEVACENQSLMRWLSERVGYRVVDLAVYAGSDSPRRKITALAIADDGNADVVVKIADTELGADAVRQESEALQAIASSPLSGHAPRLIAQGSWNRYIVQVQEAISGDGRAQMPHLTGAHFEFLAGLSKMDRTTLPCRETRIWRDLNLWASSQGSLTASSTIGVALKRVLSSEFADLPVLCHWTHGDFTPWNIRMRGGRLLVYDWEDGESDGLAYSDLFHFLFRQASLVGPWPGARTLVRAMNDAASRLSVLSGTDCDATTVLTVWCLKEYMSNPKDNLVGLVSQVSRIVNE